MVLADFGLATIMDSDFCPESFYISFDTNGYSIINSEYKEEGTKNKCYVYKNILKDNIATMIYDLIKN
jgi:hypothetical protein